MSAAQAITKAFHGDWRGNYGLIPTIGHSPKDRGTKVQDADNGDVSFTSYNGGDWREIKDECRKRGLLPERSKAGGGSRITGVYTYRDEHGLILYRTRRHEQLGRAKRFTAERPDGRGGWILSLGDTRRVLYRLPELLAADRAEAIYLVEGERKADKLVAWGLASTAVAFGAKGWNARYAGPLESRSVIILPDNDDQGRGFAERAAADIRNAGGKAIIIELPGLSAGGDIVDWTGDREELERLVLLGMNSGELEPECATDDTSMAAQNAGGVRITDFYAHMPSHSYIFIPARDFWPAPSVNSRISPIIVDGKKLSASAWLDRNRAVEQVTWAPGEPMAIEDRLISDGGWIERPECRTFNLYRPPLPIEGDASQARPWIEHVELVYPTEASHIIKWLAHRVQRPWEKINHAIVLGGAQGVGKDTLLEPVKKAIGPWNFAEVSPQHMLGRFNGFVKSVILRVSEARDLGDVDRFAFYDHLKTYTAGPPDVLRVDEKHLREYAVFNVCGVIITSNHKNDGLFLPADDRRHFVAWSELTKDRFADDYWQRLWRWYRDGGVDHVCAYLATLELTSFDAKAPPPKTEAFYDIVASNRAPEDAEMADALEKLGNPAVIALADVADIADLSFRDWLLDRRNARKVPHRMEECGYRAARNPTQADGRWKVSGKNVVVYVRRELSVRDAVAAAEAFAEGRRP